MHTLTNPLGWTANFNGDFSGDVRLTNEKTGVDVTIPFGVLKSLVGEYVRLRKTESLEAASFEKMCGIE